MPVSYLVTDQRNVRFSAGKERSVRVKFNRMGYSLYTKEQSRRVPSCRGRCVSHGYGFKQARWRDTLVNAVDAAICEQVSAACMCAVCKRIRPKILVLARQCLRIHIQEQKRTRE